MLSILPLDAFQSATTCFQKCHETLSKVPRDAFQTAFCRLMKFHAHACVTRIPFCVDFLFLNSLFLCQLSHLQLSSFTVFLLAIKNFAPLSLSLSLSLCLLPSLYLSLSYFFLSLFSLSLFSLSLSQLLLFSECSTF